jgi:hypothetical protein
MSLERSAAAAPPSGSVWPTHLRAIGAIRFGRRSARFAESVDDPRDQLCLDFPTQQAQDDARHRLTAAGAAPIPSHPYWAATGAVTYRDRDGREVRR